jgi:hypothetical protein
MFWVAASGAWDGKFPPELQMERFSEGAECRM